MKIGDVVRYNGRIVKYRGQCGEVMSRFKPYKSARPQRFAYDILLYTPKRDVLTCWEDDLEPVQIDPQSV